MPNKQEGQQSTTHKTPGHTLLQGRLESGNISVSPGIQWDNNKHLELHNQRHFPVKHIKLENCSEYS